MRTFAVFALLAVADATRLVKPAMVTTPAVTGLAKDSAVLTLRGGGMVDQSTWLQARCSPHALVSATSALTPAPDRSLCQAFSVFMGLYCIGFSVIDQNFDTPCNKYHLFISWLTGVFLLGLLYTCSKMKVAAAFPIAYGIGVIPAVLGPLYAELQLETKPAHKVCWGEASLRTLRLPVKPPQSRPRVHCAAI